MLLPRAADALRLTLRHADIAMLMPLLLLRHEPPLMPLIFIAFYCRLLMFHYFAYFFRWLPLPCHYAMPMPFRHPLILPPPLFAAFACVLISYAAFHADADTPPPLSLSPCHYAAAITLMLATPCRR